MGRIHAQKAVVCINGEEIEIGGGGGPSIYDALVDGSITRFSMPSGIIKVKNHLCAGNQSLESINLAGCTVVEEAAFYDCRKVNQINLANAHISSLGKRAFTSIGCERENKSTTKLTLDFRSSTFNTIEEETFGTNSDVGRKVENATIYFPETLRTIVNGALRYLKDCTIYFTGYAPQLLGSGVFTGYRNLKIYCDYRDLYNYKYGSNWSAITAITKGYCPRGEIEAGTTLPTFDKNGHALTWYSDETLTTQITVAIDADMFCNVSSASSASNVEVVTKDAQVVITDGTHFYNSDSPIPYGTTVTISVIGTTGYQAYIQTMNGEPLTSGATFTAAAGEKLLVVAIYWDGEHTPIDPVLENNSWSVIAQVCKEGRALECWALGATKTITFQGLIYTVRLCDASASRYSKSDGSGGNKVVFEFTNTFATTAKMNNSNTNTGGYAESVMRKTTLPALFDQLPEELKTLIQEVDIYSASDGSTSGTGTLSSSSCKLFLASEYEIFGKRTYSNVIEESAQFGLYALNNTNTFRIKRPIGGAAAIWWLRSPIAGSTNYFCLVYTNGSASYYHANSSYGVSPCFCF